MNEKVVPSLGTSLAGEAGMFGNTPLQPPCSSDARFGDDGFFTARFPLPAMIASDVSARGFHVYERVVHPHVIRTMREFWLEHFAGVRPHRGVVRGMLRLGEPNFTAFTDSRRWCLFRDFDFLWNEPTHALTREVAIALHACRNRAQGLAADAGLAYRRDCYGIYVSTSYYPPGRGRLAPHVDGHRDVPILHHILPLTYRGPDYADGGLFLVDESGRRIDVDAMMSPGSIAFYDGRLTHGVDTIVPHPAKGLGRLAMFAIPTFFKRLDELPAPLRLLESAYHRARRRIAERRLFGAPKRPALRLASGSSEP